MACDCSDGECRADADEGLNCGKSSDCEDAGKLLGGRNESDVEDNGDAPENEVKSLEADGGTEPGRIRIYQGCLLLRSLLLLRNHFCKSS